MSNQQPPSDPYGNQWRGVPPEGEGGQAWPQHEWNHPNQLDGGSAYGADAQGQPYGSAQQGYGQAQSGQQPAYGQPQNYGQEGQYGQAEQFDQQQGYVPQQGYGQQPQYGQSQQQFGQPQYGYQASQGYAGNDANAGNPWQQQGQAPKRRRKWLIPVAAIAAVAVIGGAIWGGIALFSGQGRGAASAEEAVDKLITSGTNLDYLGSFAMVAPSEADIFTTAAERLLASDFGDVGDGVSLSDGLADLASASTTKTEGLEYETEELAEGVERVTITAGTVTVDGDQEAITQATESVIRSLAYEGALLAGESESEAVSAADDAAEEAMSDYNFDDEYPQTFDFADEDFNTLISTYEGGKWYVSMMLSGADYALGGMSGDKLSSLDVVEGNGASGPEEAGMQALESVFELGLGGGDFDTAVATFARPERLLFSMFSQSFGSGSGYSSYSDYEFGGGFTTIDVNGVTMIRPDNITIDDGYQTITIDGTCYEVSNSYSEPMCLEDIPVVSALGLDELGIAVVQEDSGWVVSLYKTAEVWLDTAVENYLVLRDEGRLDELQF
ncbi:hypothetical protein [Gulosibacter sp. ACHW.36C]|uniref:Uncharacterized protein n=1 Tax=Gulosibacter sediminis TaxID=1729695 RepID=A0ABY4MVF1_9MICO|nr:hypothetical protein [Gulosibacter sediminis]UQN14364.1 hypothetical protein M3M28_09935 [Gulosibacter sediminis]